MVTIHFSGLAPHPIIPFQPLTLSCFVPGAFSFAPVMRRAFGFDQKFRLQLREDLRALRLSDLAHRHPGARLLEVKAGGLFGVANAGNRRIDVIEYPALNQLLNGSPYAGLLHR